jgi:hypothetical protein
VHSVLIISIEPNLIVSASFKSNCTKEESTRTKPKYQQQQQQQQQPKPIYVVVIFLRFQGISGMATEGQDKNGWMIPKGLSLFLPLSTNHCRGQCYKTFWEFYTLKLTAKTYLSSNLLLLLQLLMLS